MKRFLCSLMIVLMLMTLASCQTGGYDEGSYLDEWTQGGEETYQETTQENTAYENDNSTQSSNQGNNNSGNSNATQSSNKGNITSGNSSSTQSSNKGNSTSGNNSSTQSSNQGNSTSGNSSSAQKVYKKGETWVVPGVWEMTLNDVFMHSPCNSFDEYYGTNQPVIVLDITFKNIGYSWFVYEQEMRLYENDFIIYDATGTQISLDGSGCIHAVEDPTCIHGTKGHSQLSFTIAKDADLSKITISCIKQYDDENGRSKTPYGLFESTVDKTDRFATADESNDSTNNEQTKEPTSNNTNSESTNSKEETAPEEDETLWTYSEANKLYSYVGNAKDYAKKAVDHMTKATSIANQALKLSYIKMAQSYISYAVKDLERAKTLAENNSTVSYTDGTVLLDEINAAITQCSNFKDKSLTAEETENQTHPLYNDVSDIYQKTNSLSMFANKILQEFTNI